MAGNDLNQKYTIERYCSKADLAKAFGTGIVEPIWKEINEFRKKFAVDMPIYDAAHMRFRLTYIDPMQAKNAQTNDHMTAYVGGYSKLQAGSVAQHTFSRDMLKNSLRAIARFNKLDASDITISNILDGRQIDSQYKLLQNYYRCLLEVRLDVSTDINEEFLAKYYLFLRGEEELTSFYRISDANTVSSRALVDRTYDQGIPSHLIDDIMPELLTYIDNTEVSLASRLSALFFMFNYVKPFDEYNMELACILAKRVIAKSNANASSIYIPIESFINDSDFFGETTTEVKKTHDFTYAFLKGADLIIAAFDVAIDRILDVHANSLESEVKLGNNEKQIKKEFGIEPVIKPKPVTEKRETKAQIIAKAESNAMHSGYENLSERELREKANELLERFPNLSKKQCHFYVHHCTPGRYYSIQQFAKFEKCVYETARTSMEFLATEGFYRKQSVKNKFVYTPINKE